MPRRTTPVRGSRVAANGRAPRRGRWLRRSDRQAGVRHELGHVVAERDAEPLPLHAQHAVALQVAEGAVVGDQLEAVVRSFEGAAGSVPSVAPIADVRGQRARPGRRGRAGGPDGPPPPRCNRGARNRPPPGPSPPHPDRSRAAPPRAHRRRRELVPRAVPVRATGATRAGTCGHAWSARYSDHSPPRAGMSTRWRNEGMTLRNSSSMRSA